ncbi:trans-2-enoyl-CoA reductase family protein [Vibrio sp. ZSDE26]|uniref:Enoyl-[acyl-carrier-protein] reductase [NADH] n=1 Tax=Vibrio amylolyticus TaxID=2847292 RepID=A0A9X1XK33_9VIBR|nr:enoyl-ACP reductase FabV [Vibrio amylolyticus]MCK6263891.1 trans-2-enoyl-CoA reductase family protein [Vibrio amylolyticus]
MIIKPIIQGMVARSAHPLGCEQAVLEQIKIAKQSDPIKDGPKKVLILGASSGFGLASRIALTFGGCSADTIGVSLERGPCAKGGASAGWFNNHYFKQHAEASGHIAINIDGDAFAESTRLHVIEAIETYFEGEVDLIIYSLATGARPNPETGELWRSTIKPIGERIKSNLISLEDDRWSDVVLEPATEKEAQTTIKVMGGEDWESWIDTLINSESIAQGCQTIAFSYVGPEVTHPLYLDGTLGRAKIDLHQTSHSLNLKLANYRGGAYATVCKALVTKASVFIPGLTPYMIALYKVMKEKGLHEGCIEQMQRLYRDRLFGQKQVPLDCERLIRMDDWELLPEVQREVSTILTHMNSNNFAQIGDYDGFKSDFLKLNGFNFETIDYMLPVNTDVFINSNN